MGAESFAGQGDESNQPLYIWLIWTIMVQMDYVLTCIHESNEPYANIISHTKQ